jgi:PAX-interacting protein 1
MSTETLTAAVNDISSVVSMSDMIAGSAPGNGSRAAVGEDLVSMTNCRLQARNFITQDGTSGIRKIKRYTSARPLNVVSSAGSKNDSIKELSASEASQQEPTATSNVKKPKVEVLNYMFSTVTFYFIIDITVSFTVLFSMSSLLLSLILVHWLDSMIYMGLNGL